MNKFFYVVLFSALMFSTITYAAEEKKVFILTSQPIYSSMELITSDSLWLQIPIVSSAPTYTYTSFVDAYREFNDKVNDYVKKNVKQYNLDGVCNLKIQFQVTDKMYYFVASFDYWQFKK